MIFPLRGAQQRSDDKLYVEDVFSAYTYTGTGDARSIVNGIDLAGEGGMVWTKGRNSAQSHVLYDTARGATKELVSHSTNAETTQLQGLTAFNNDGYSIGTLGQFTQSGVNFVGLTFRKAPKFFDVVTYTGNGATQSIAHDLGIAPGMVVTKRLSATGNWNTWHRGLTAGNYIALNITAGESNSSTANFFGNNSVTVDPTATHFTIGNIPALNGNGDTFIAYLFAHDDSDEGIIQCGSYTGNGSAAGPIVNLGWEPQYVMIKRSDSTGSWVILDTARGLVVNDEDAALFANNSNTESVGAAYLNLTGSGFQVKYAGADFNASGGTFVYMAIRKGNMRVPTDATKVLEIIARGGNGGNDVVSLSTVRSPDFGIIRRRNGTANFNWQDRLRGTASQLTSTTTAAETTLTTRITNFGSDSFGLGADSVTNGAGATYINYLLKQARGFLDIVAYTGTGAAKAEAHNLGVAPELMIVKSLNAAADWAIYYGDPTDYLVLNSTAVSVDEIQLWNDTAPTATEFTVGQHGSTGWPARTYIAYLFASCPGVSKVGTFISTGAAQQIDCGFTSGARLVMLKSIDSTSAWYILDTVRGIVAAADPYLLFNSTQAEVSFLDVLDPYAQGFELAGGIFSAGVTCLYMAIA